MGKAPSPVKRGNTTSGGSGGGGAGGAGHAGSSLGGAAAAGDEMLLTERAERVESTVVSRENATHLAFATSRTRAFPYAASTQYIHLLNDYCNSTDGADTSSASSSSSLLVVVGSPGTGKSSLLAHWAALRRASEDGAHEFIYEHYCGCSFDSVKLSLFLFRLMNQLKITFALRDFELPREHEEEKLKFSFARCLEAAVGRTNQRAGGGAGGGGSGAASKRRTIVLILDGIDCIRNEDGGDSLSWLPNTFPPGVRIIVSAGHAARSSQRAAALQSARAVTRKPVVYDDDGDLIYDTSLPPSDHDSHTIRELRRRRVSFIVVEPLDEPSCRAVLQLYNRTAATKTSTLSESEQDALVAAPGSANPLYLRLILQGQELFEQDPVGRAMWLDRATKAREIHSVYELLIRRWNELLLEDLSEQLRKLTTPPDPETTDSPSAHKMVRRATKRDVTAKDGDGNNNNNQAHHPHPTLTRTPSVRSSTTTTQQAADPAELETLHVAMEQRVLLARHTLSLLAVSRYGLSDTDLQRLLGDAVPRAVCQRLFTLLAPHVMQIRRRDCGGDDVTVLLDLSHNQLRLLVRYGFLQDDQLRACYYKELATYFGGLEASQRRIDELPVQLERCGLWSALQGALVDIKMFQLWWAERNRQEFFSYWMVLRSNCSVHDPVDDFVRSLDEYVTHESPSAEQLLALCLTITDFLRAWQRIDDSRSAQLALARPAPPQLNEFITSLGGFFSTSHLSEHEAKKVQSEIDALCAHKDDAYFVRRWLWAQFPLIAVAFECRFLRSLLAGKSSTALLSTSSPNDAAVAAQARDDDTSSHTSGSHHTSQASGSSSSSSSKKAVVVLPRGFDKGKNASPIKPAKRTPSLLFGASGGASSSSTDDGAFEFLSTENTELTVGSVAKFEAQVMELRVRYDKLKFTAKARRDALATLESRLLDARAQAHAAGQSASQVDELLDQIRQIGDETQVGRQRGDYYKAILRHCEIHPARDPNAIEVTETAVNKMKQDIVELQQKTQVASYEARLAGAESKKLHQVIADKTQIHHTALERLRWRLELLQRMMMQQRKAAVGARRDAVDAATRPLREKGDGSGDEEDEEDDEDEEERENGDPGESKDGRRRSRMQSSFVDEQASQLSRAKDKLLHKKATTLERLRKVESLKVYVGSPYKDDGVLGALRQVGINKPEEAQLYWQDQQQHAAQLEADEKNLEQRVADYRDKVAALQTQLLNLKLGGSSAVSSADSGSGSDAAASSSPSVGSGAGSAPTAIASGTDSTSSNGGSGSSGGTGATSSSSSHNLKLLEQQLGDALTVMQQKKERAARVKSLSERLHLGLQHVAHILGVSTTQQMESIELADAVEQVVRLYLGDEGHMPSTTASNLRRKNSVRAMGMATQSGLHAIAPPDTRSPDEKRRFNLRVSKSPQRQMNPYVDGEAAAGGGFGGRGFDQQGDDNEDDEEDDEDEDDEDDVGTNQRDAADSVTRRADIKNRSRLEVDRKLRTPASSKAPRVKAGKTPKAAAAAHK